MTDHDGDDRAPRAIAGNSSFGFSRVRPGPNRHTNPGADDQPADRRAPARDCGATSFEAGTDRKRARECWKALVVVLFVLVAVTLLAATVAQVAAGVDAPALWTGDPVLLTRIDAALATAATEARLVAVAAGGLAVVGAGAAGLVAAARSGP